uniref:Uncharacterized protein n=1 Tax=Agrobacterium tumefaciens TaxID=358 RepID=A0A3Q8BM74_AGRTU|nr:hypothetical protein AgrTiEU6_213 [Agrobacterium tumefaciens]
MMSGWQVAECREALVSKLARLAAGEVVYLDVHRIEVGLAGNSGRVDQPGMHQADSRNFGSPTCTIR